LNKLPRLLGSKAHGRPRRRGICPESGGTICPPLSLRPLLVGGGFVEAVDAVK
jgi:hypothetical protein